MTFTLRDYQESAVNTGINFFEKKSEKNGIEVVPTGGGKSLVIGGIASNIKGKTLVLQPSKEILEQNYKKAQKFMGGFSMGDYDLGIYSASFGMKQVRKITFATIGSVIGKKEIFEQFDNIIQDECHFSNAKGGMYQEFFEHLGKPVLGLSATPYRLHPPTSFNNSVIKFIHRTRPRIFHDLLHVTQNGTLFERGYLSPIRYTREEFDAAQLSLNSTGAEFTEVSVKRHGQETDLTGKVIRYVKESAAPHILIFMNSIEEANNVLKRLSSIGIDAAVLTGETPTAERDKMLAAFTSGVLRILINCGVLTVGFDFPALTCIINARITNSLSLYYQIIGRGIRISPDTGKTHCDYIDLGGNITRFGNIESFEIVGEKGKERLKSGIRFLTGVDLKTSRDLEAAREPAEGSGMPISAPPATGDEVMGFGKHTGERLRNVPAGYLQWLAENANSYPTKMMAKNELGRRSSALKEQVTNG